MLQKSHLHIIVFVKYFTQKNFVIRRLLLWWTDDLKLWLPTLSAILINVAKISFAYYGFYEFILTHKFFNQLWLLGFDSIIPSKDNRQFRRLVPFLLQCSSGASMRLRRICAHMRGALKNIWYITKLRCAVGQVAIWGKR